MASKLPIVRQAAWLSIISQFILISIIIFICKYFFPENYILIGLIIYFSIIYTLRMTIPSKHRKGVRLFKQKRFEEAIRYFQESYSFFTKHKWLDRFRFITILSSSRISYTEMALLNEAFCLGQLEKKAEAIEKYEFVLKLFPDSEMAISALKMLK